MVAANPNMIVVLNTGSAVTMPWLSSVAGVFENWYPGQQAGNAIAASGVISGTATAGGSSTVAVTATDGNGVSGSATSVWTVDT
ncbi:MAG TPA: glycoside hydrolase family 3 C-terminal domain-containing protein [Actinocrinis sp.]|nr:glycoside hydrolase family 3 C-terminal domain-containing protein [Actinocrinis sp.]